MNLQIIKEEIKSKANPLKAQASQRFFKTGKNQYAEGDLFLGLSVPECRKIATQYKNLSFENIKFLLQSKIHEERLIALFILVLRYQNKNERESIFNFYISSIENINNWDLVDSSAYKILDRYLYETNFLSNNSLLEKLAVSNNLWQRRISIVSTLYLIKHNNFDHTLKIASILLNDQEDLIHKATGWMLREIGEKNIEVLKNFLNQYYKQMPRTMMRYSIEKLSVEERNYYLKK